MEQHRKFPQSGNVRAKASAEYLGIGESTFWLKVKEGKIKKPIKLGPRISTWEAEYIRDLAKNGIGEAA